jgi:hypothetical protein
MNTYKVPVTWREYGYVLIEADSEVEAIRLTHDADLPSDSEYLEDLERIKIFKFFSQNY